VLQVLNNVNLNSSY